MILKIMTYRSPNDADPKYAHRIIEAVGDVEFYEAETLALQTLTHDPRPARVSFWLKSDPDVSETVYLSGNVYVLNDSGKTISIFEVPGPISQV